MGPFLGYKYHSFVLGFKSFKQQKLPKDVIFLKAVWKINYAIANSALCEFVYKHNFIRDIIAKYGRYVNDFSELKNINYLG